MLGYRIEVICIIIKIVLGVYTVPSASILCFCKEQLLFSQEISSQGPTLSDAYRLCEKVHRARGIIKLTPDRFLQTIYLELAPCCSLEHDNNLIFVAALVLNISA